MSFKDKLHPLIRRKRNNKYNDTNYAVINAFDTVLDEMETETLESKAQSAIHTATGWFLDNGWGSWFGVKRNEGETDEEFRERIIYKIQVPRGTIEAVKYGIREYLDNEYVGIKIYEPWEDIFYLNDSKLNSDAHLIGEYYNYGVMDITIGSSFPKDMLKVIDLFKPAGVTVHVRVDTNLPSIDPNAKPGLLATQTLNASEYNATYNQVIGMDEGINGVFSVYDNLEDIYGDEFATNKSLVNDDNDLLANTFKKLDGLAHNVSVGPDFSPSREFNMDEVISKTDTLVSKDSSFTIQDNNKGYIYFTLDTSILYDVHNNYSLGRTREAFIDYLADHNIILKSIGTKGQGYSIEYFNFLNREWETVSNGLYGNTGNTNSFKLEIGKALNDSLLITVRLKTNNKPLTVSDFHMEYQYQGTLTESVLAKGNPLETIPVPALKLATLPSVSKFSLTDPITTDPHFESGLNGALVYNNLSDDSIKINHEVSLSSTQSYGKSRLRITHSMGNQNLFKTPLASMAFGSNNRTTYPITGDVVSDPSGDFWRIKRADLDINSSMISIYNTLRPADMDPKLINNGTVIVTFQAKASHATNWNGWGVTFGGQTNVLAHTWGTGTAPNEAGNNTLALTTEWQTFYCVFSNIPADTTGLRVIPRETDITGIAEGFYIDLKDYRMKNGNRVGGGAPYRGGLGIPIIPKENSVFYVEFEAHAPIGSKLRVHYNYLGVGGFYNWLTDDTGKGSFQKYGFVVGFGVNSDTMVMGSGGYISIDYHPIDFNWYVSQYQIYDISKTQGVLTEEQAKQIYPQGK